MSGAMEAMERNKILAYELIWCTEHGDDDFPSIRKAPFVEVVKFVKYLLSEIDCAEYAEQERAANAKEKTGTSPNS